MAFSNAAKNAALDAIGAAASWLSVHSADPGTTGAAEVPSSTRSQTTWSNAVNGSKTGSTASVGVPAGATAAFWGLWSAQNGGTFHTGGPLTSETFNGAGVYNITPTLTA